MKISMIKPRRRDFRNDTAGSADIQSITVGVLLIAIITAIISAIVYALIPWAQNITAQSSLSAVPTAQVGYNTVGDTTRTTYASLEELVSVSVLPASVMDRGEDDMFAGVGDRDQFAAAIESGSGEMYILSSADTKPTNIRETDGQEEAARIRALPKKDRIEAALALAVKQANNGLAEVNRIDGELTSESCADVAINGDGGSCVNWDTVKLSLNPTP